MKEQFKKLPLDKKIKYTFLMILFFPILLLFMGAVANAKAEARQSMKYKKVIKKGLLWDTEYLIER